MKKAWTAERRLIQPDILIETSFDVATVIEFTPDLLDKSTLAYAQAKQRLLDEFVDEYTLG